MCWFYMGIAHIAFEIGIVWSQTGVTLFIEVLGKLGPELFLRQIGYNLPRTINSLLQGYSGNIKNAPNFGWENRKLMSEVF